MRSRVQLFIILLVVIVSVVGTIGYFVYDSMSAHYLRQMRATMTGYAHSVSLLIDGDAHEAFANPQDMNAPVFVAMANRLRAFMEADERISRIYTMMKTDRPNI